MAGAGYKLFNTGDVLTAAQVNTYLQEQVVMVFANAAARTTALSGVLAEGMVTYLKDTDALEIYSGTAWVGYGSGDITGITTGATSGLTGGVTSGTADLKFNTTAKGGLLVGTGSGTVTELSVGSNNTVLTADSSTASGLKWATSSSGGMTLITSGNLGASGATLSSITSAYTDLYLYIYGVKFDTASKYIGVWIAGASSTIPNNYILNGTGSTDNYIRFGTTQQFSSGNMSLGILFKNYAGTAGSKPVFFAGNSNDGTNNNRLSGGGATSSTSAISTINIENATGGGNITAGSYELWGIK